MYHKLKKDNPFYGQKGVIIYKDEYRKMPDSHKELFEKVKESDEEVNPYAPNLQGEEVVELLNDRHRVHRLYWTQIRADGLVVNQNDEE